LLVSFGTKDLRLTTSFRFEDLRLLGALSGEDRRAAVALGAHLLLHRVLDGDGRVDRLQLDATDADAPLARRLVEHDPELSVDVVAAGQRLFEVQTADDVSQ